MKAILLYIIQILMLAIFAQVVISWLVVLGIRSPLILSVYRAVTTVNEPIMRPLRKVIPNFGMIDITPMVAIIVLVIIQEVIARAL